MARRRAFQFCLVLVIFLLVASFVQCEDADSDSDGLVGFRVRISRWFLTSKRVVQQLQERSAIETAVDQQARRAEKSTAANSGAATLLWAVGPPAESLRQEDEKPGQLVGNGGVAFRHVKQEANEAASMPVEARPILRRGAKMEEAHSDEDEDREHGHWHHRKHKHGGDHDGKWQRRLAACRVDGERFCRHITSNWLSMDSVNMPDVLLCLSQYQASLSPQCSAELSSCATFKCGADAARLCSSALNEDFRYVSTSWDQKKQRMFTCLEGRSYALSGTCLSAINERRMRHGKPALQPTETSSYGDPDASVEKRYPYEDGDGSDYNYEPTRTPYYPRPPRPSDSKEDVASISSSNNGNALPQWALIALVAISAAFLFMTALTVILLVQLKRRRQREAVMAAANSLSLPPLPPADVRSQFEMPYHRLDEVQLV